jgi:serine/threonine protein kinase
VKGDGENHAVPPDGGSDEQLAHAQMSERDRARLSTVSLEFDDSKLRNPVELLTTLARGSTGESESTLAPGQRIHQFEVIRELGRGGMGRVVLARDTKLGRLVALKLMQVQSEARIQRFLAEARTTARCNHEHIVVIHEAGEWQGQPYLVLEYLEGSPLSTLMRGRALSTRRALELVMPVVRALIRAHELGIVHRDLKPENIFVTRSGLVKVLDFGVAKLFADNQVVLRDAELSEPEFPQRTEGASGVGTIPYMAPEQWRGEEVDHRSDLWAVGVILWEMLTGQHPLGVASFEELRAKVPLLSEPMPAMAKVRPDLPVELVSIIDRCLEKRKVQRFGSARELSEALEPLFPSSHVRPLSDGENPYPGMRAFQEGEGDRYFGRKRDVEHLLSRIREHPLVGVVGASGVGKSSLVRAGVVPQLRSASESWEVLVTRPGRSPLSTLAGLLETSLAGTDVLPSEASRHGALLGELRDAPGTLGTLLRERARKRKGQILLFVDQFEELYTLCPDLSERRAYTACLAGVADDPSTPLRVVVSMRSDFLDRVAEDRHFLDRLTTQLFLLAPITAEGLREALLEPLERAHHALEAPELADEIVSALEGTAGSLPLLQFAAEKLWEARDRRRRLLTSESYRALGGVAGALATHADEVLASLSSQQRRLTRALFQKLVTREGTRALTELSELAELSAEPSEVEWLIDHLTAARLLAVHPREDKGPAVEIVHESLITSWPTLRRWREETMEDAAFLQELRDAARQWDTRERPVDLLWRGELVDEAQRFQHRFRGELTTRERQFLTAVLEQATLRARRTRRLTLAAFAFLLFVVVAGAVALVRVRSAELKAQQQRAAAEQAAERSKVAEQRVKQQLETIKRKESERAAAEQAAKNAEEQVRRENAKLELTYEQLEQALAKAEQARETAQREQARAESAAHEVQVLANSEREAKQRVEQLLQAERARVEELEREQRRLSTKLK